jgi:hypothetical protein
MSSFRAVNASSTTLVSRFELHVLAYAALLDPQATERSWCIAVAAAGRQDNPRRALRSNLVSASSRTLTG